jgi:hypothetical protein
MARTKWTAVSTWSDGTTTNMRPGTKREAEQYARRMRDVALVTNVTEPMRYSELTSPR